MTNLTRVQITQRNRERHKILKEELCRNGITERRLYIDDRLYSRLEEIAGEYGESVHDIMFVAMRDFLAKHDDVSYDNHYFLLDAVMLIAHSRMVERGLGGFRTDGLGFTPKETHKND